MSPASICVLLAALPLPLQDQYADRRERMVREQIQSRGIQDQRVLKVMREVPRHEFIPPQLRSQAYEDTPLPIGHGQTISQPYIVAFMTELLEPASQHRVLEIGTGSAYQAAVLSPLVKAVYTIEIVPELAKLATDKLRALGYANVTVRLGDGYKGWPDQAPFDRIILTAAPPSLPQTLLDQLKPGGRLVAPVGDNALNQELLVVDKAADGKIRRKSVLAVRFVPMVPGRN